MVKEKVHITVDKEILNWIDEQIDNKRFRNTSHAFEYCVYRMMKEHRMVKS